MPNLKITAATGQPTSVLLDGVEINRHLLAEGFEVDFGNPLEMRPPSVRMRVVLDTLEVDLPDTHLQVALETASMQ